jgi:hypothetical protein
MRVSAVVPLVIRPMEWKNNSMELNIDLSYSLMNEIMEASKANKLS